MKVQIPSDLYEALINMLGDAVVQRPHRDVMALVGRLNREVSLVADIPAEPRESAHE